MNNQPLLFGFERDVLTLDGSENRWLAPETVRVAQHRPSRRCTVHQSQLLLARLGQERSLGEINFLLVAKQAMPLEARYCWADCAKNGSLASRG